MYILYNVKNLLSKEQAQEYYKVTGLQTPIWHLYWIAHAIYVPWSRDSVADQAVLNSLLSSCFSLPRAVTTGTSHRT